MTAIVDDETLENYLADMKLIKDVLGLDFDGFDRYRLSAMRGLKQFGGGFAQALGDLLEVSGIHDSIKILNTWKNLCSEHEMLYRIFEAKQLALKEGQSAN